MTRYKILRRRNDGLLEEVETYETNGPEQAMRRAMDPDTGVLTLAEGESMVAVPEGNWTERTGRVNMRPVIELADPDQLTIEPAPEPDPADDPVAA